MSRKICRKITRQINRDCTGAVKQVTQNIGKEIKDMATLLEKLKEIPHDPVDSLESCILYIETRNQETANTIEKQIPSTAVFKR